MAIGHPPLRGRAWVDWPGAAGMGGASWPTLAGRGGGPAVSGPGDRRTTAPSFRRDCSPVSDALIACRGLPLAGDSHRSPSPQTGGRGRPIHGEVSNKTADAGLRSAARNNKATRLLTRPGRTSQSSARVSSRRAVKLQSRAASSAACPFKVLAVPIRIRVRRAGEDRPVPAWILT